MHGSVRDVELGLSISLGVEDPGLQQAVVSVDYRVQLRLIQGVWGELHVPANSGLQALLDTLLDLFVRRGNYL